MRKLGPVVVIAVFAVVMFFLFAGMPGGTEETPPEPIVLPESWNGYQRSFLVDGEEGLMDFTRQHIKKIPIKDGVRAGYKREGADFELWVAHGASDAHAAQMLQDMTTRIGSAHQVFTEPKPVDLAGATVYRTTGQDRINFYWVKGRRVYWLGLKGENDPEALARKAHAEL